MKVMKIIIHHSATKDQYVADWAAIRKYHIEENGWNDIAYHYGIEMANGKYVIQKGRQEWVAGAHTVGQNSVSLGICVVGNYDKVQPHPDALKLLAKLCADICKRYKLTPDKIETHNKYASYKTCPGTSFPMDKLRLMVKELLK